MALACRIMNGTVEAPNGAVSILYESLSDRFGKEKALDLYALTETVEYKDKNFRKDRNGEMREADFLKFAFLEEDPLDLRRETVDFLQRFNSSDITKLEGLYIKGVFQPTITNLRATGLFLEDEIYNISFSKSAQKALKNFIELNEEVTVGLVDDIRVEDSSYNTIGIRPLKNPMEVEQDVLEVLLGSETDNEIDVRVDTLPYPSVIEKYKTDGEYREGLRNKVKNSARVKVARDGDSTVELLLDTVDVSKIGGISDTAYRIAQLTDKDLVIEEFEVVVEDLIKAGVEIDFDELYLNSKSLEELKTFSRVLEAFVNKPDINTTQNLAQQIESFSNTPKEVIAQYNNNGRVSPNNLRNLITRKGEVEVFEKMGMVHHKGDTYLKVQDKYSVEELYDVLYNAVVRDPSIVGMENIPSVEGDMGILGDSINKEVTQDLKNLILERAKGLEVADTETQQKIEIYKAYYGSDVNTEQLNSIVGPQENDTYIKEKFIGNFNSDRLRSKMEDNEEYNNFYKYFKVDHLGISLLNDNQFTKDIVLNTAPSEVLPNLLRYSELTGSMDLGVQERIIDPLYKDRLEAQQNPKSVSELQRDYSVAGLDEVVTDDVGDFTKIRGEVYEKALEYKDKTLYKKLPKSEGLFKNLNIDKPISDKTETFLREFVVTKDNQVKYKKHLTKAEIAEINEKHFACS